MHLNYSAICSLAELDSNHFDKEGLLFVRERKEGLLNHWKSETFIERLCRLRGNLLFVINVSNSGEKDEPFEKNARNSVSSRVICPSQIVFILILEECVVKLNDESNKHFSFIIEFSKNDPTRPMHFASISQHERDSWVECIHLSSLSYLRSLRKTFMTLKLSSGLHDDDLENSSSLSDCSMSSDPLCNSFLNFTICCEVLSTDYIPSNPNLLVGVFYRQNAFTPWKFFDKSEIVSLKSAKFAKQFSLPSDDWSSFHLKFKVYDVIERFSNTKILLGESLYIPSMIKFLENTHQLELDICSLVKSSQVIGKLRVTFKGSVFQLSSSPAKQLKMPKSLPLYGASINSVTDTPKMPDHSSLMKDNSSSSLPPNRRSSVSSNDTPTNQTSNNSLVMSLPINWNLESDFFGNIIHRSFLFEVPLKGLSLNVEELMAESKYSLIVPQLIMNIFMEDEKKLMNCVTYSLGEVKSDYQRSQMRLLESHLRLVNVVTESLNELYKIQLDRRYFRASIFKKEVYFQYVPINFHLQRFLVCKADENRCDISWENSRLDIYSVGAFAAHYLGFEQDSNMTKITSRTRRDSEKAYDLNVAKAWISMRNLFKISATIQIIDATMKQLIAHANRSSSEETRRSLYNIIEENAKILINVTTSREVDEILAFLSSLKSSTNNKTVSQEGRSTQVRKLEEYMSSSKEDLELEPLDLIHLNVKASLISLSSKITHAECTPQDLEPSWKKLSSANEALLRISSICYAIESIKLEREQLEMFYDLRLRRGMLFSQALSSLIAAVMHQIKNPVYQKLIYERKCIFAYFESLLSCYAQEIGMLNDMTYAVDELNHSTTFIFVNKPEATRCSEVPKIEGNGFNLRIIIEISSENLPEYFEAYVTALIFNIGINEKATLAETLGYVRQQERINRENFLKLEDFITSHQECDPIIVEYLIGLRTELWAPKTKNVQILQYMELICCKLSGLRFTSCKSAKDRTSMALTLEEVRFCSNKFGLDETKDGLLLQQMLDTLRSEGTRRENTRKNIGIAKYNLNSLNVMTFPKLYQPPPGTYGNIRDTQYEMT